MNNYENMTQAEREAFGIRELRGDGFPVYDVDEAFGMKDEQFARAQIEQFISTGKNEDEKIQILMTMFFPDLSYPRPLLAEYAGKIQKGKM